MQAPTPVSSGEVRELVPFYGKRDDMQIAQFGNLSAGGEKVLARLIIAKYLGRMVDDELNFVLLYAIIAMNFCA